MTTKIRRGRDPEQHVVHSSKAEADKFIGLLGEISLVRDGLSIVELRAHDGSTPGGAAQSLRAAANIGAGLPSRVVVPPLTVTTDGAGVVTVHHQLGYFPIVQVLDVSGLRLDAEILHIDNENLEITVPVPGDVIVNLA